MASVTGASIVHAIINGQVAPTDVYMGAPPQGEPRAAVAVQDQGGREPLYVIGAREPRYLTDEALVIVRAPDRDSQDGNDWARAVVSNIRDALLGYRGDRSVRVDENLFLHHSIKYFLIRSTFQDVWIMQRAGPRYRRGPQGGSAGFDNLVSVKYDPTRVRPFTLDLDWTGGPFTVYEPTHQAPPPATVQTTNVADGRVIIGGRIECMNPVSVTNPADDAFPAGAPQGAFAGAAAGEVLWRDTSVAARTTGSGGSREVNLFTGNLDDVPGRLGGGTVNLLKVVLNANDSVSFVTRDRFTPDLESNGLFIARAGGRVYTFPLNGAPVNRVGDWHYDVTPVPAQGFKSSTVESETLWDWAFADGSTWMTGPYQTHPPDSGAAWEMTWTVTDGTGTELFHEVFQFTGAGEALVEAFELQPSDGQVIQRVVLRDRSTPSITPRSRFGVPCLMEGMIVHGEEGAGAPPEQPEPATADDHGYTEGYSTGFEA